LAKQNDTTTTSYRDYNEEAVVQSLAEWKKVALFFYAAWCPTCRNLDKEIKNQVASLPADFIIYKVNYDRSSDLKQKYWVTTQHTIVFIDKDMNLVDKIIWANFDEIITK
jgi:thioredoxin-like negative regulator of GroEL